MRLKVFESTSNHLDFHAWIFLHCSKRHNCYSRFERKKLCLIMRTSFWEYTNTLAFVKSIKYMSENFGLINFGMNFIWEIWFTNNRFIFFVSLYSHLSVWDYFFNVKFRSNARNNSISDFKLLFKLSFSSNNFGHRLKTNFSLPTLSHILRSFNRDS